jgi:hypothetical protein
MLLIKVGLSGGIAIRNGNLAEMVLPALFAVVTGVLIVFIGRYTLAKLPNVKTVDAIATGGLFGAVSGSTLAAALTVLEEQGIKYEPWAAALYPFMDIPALVTAIVVASIYLSKKRGTADEDLSKQEYLSQESVAQASIPASRSIPPAGRSIAASSALPQAGIPASSASGSKYGPS